MKGEENCIPKHFELTNELTHHSYSRTVQVLYLPGAR